MHIRVCNKTFKVNIKMVIKFLDLGSNIIEFVGRPMSCPVSYHLLDEPNGKLPMFTIEDSKKA